MLWGTSKDPTSMSYLEKWLEEARISSLEQQRWGRKVRTSMFKNLKGSQVEVGSIEDPELGPVGDNHMKDTLWYSIKNHQLKVWARWG